MFKLSFVLRPSFVKNLPETWKLIHSVCKPLSPNFRVIQFSFIRRSAFCKNTPAGLQRQTIEANWFLLIAKNFKSQGVFLFAYYGT